MSQSDAWRYRPLASELRSGRSNLRRRWEYSAENEARNAARRPAQNREPALRGWDGLRWLDKWGGKLYSGFYAGATAAALRDYESDVRRSGSPTDDWGDFRPRGYQQYSPGTYSSYDVIWRPDSRDRWDRKPKPQDMPWPDDTGAAGGGTKGQHKSHFFSTVRYERS